MATIPNYDQQALQQLAERTQYERWLLEAVYAIAEQNINSEHLEEIRYSVAGKAYRHYVLIAESATYGDWRPGFLNAGAPLMFVSAFKLLDMLVEWVIEANGKKADFKFKIKLKQLETNPLFPPLIESRDWLKQRLLGLYQALEPYRGTIIHHSQFVSEHGVLNITTTKKALPPMTLSISSEQLRALAQIVVGTIRFVDGTWQLANYQEKMLRFQLDNIQPFHGQPALLQPRPAHISVRSYQLVDETSVDLARIQQDLVTRYPEQDVSFDLTLVLVSDQQAIAAFLFGWDLISAMADVWDTDIELHQYSIAIPTDINPQHLSVPSVKQL